jgi:hypothetical protein
MWPGVAAATLEALTSEGVIAPAMGVFDMELPPLSADDICTSARGG